LRRESVGRAAIVTFQWTLLGAAGYVAASNIYVLAVEAVTISDVAAAVMYLVAVRSPPDGCRVVADQD
jgi:hypothetical protein